MNHNQGIFFQNWDIFSQFSKKSRGDLHPLPPLVTQLCRDYDMQQASRNRVGEGGCSPLPDFC